MKKITFILAFAFITLSSFSQIKVLSSGKAYIGTLPNSTQDPDNVIKFQVFGTGAVGSCGRIAIGDYGRQSTGSCNVVVGEYGNYDSDQLWLHGAQGIYLTTTASYNTVVGYYDVAYGNKFTFNCDVWSNGVKLTSDERLKTNVSKISNSMTNLRKLNGVSYNLLNKQSLEANKSITKSSSVSDTIKLTEKEQKNKAFFEAYEAKIKANSPKRFGYLAQELMLVFPSLVDKDSAGYYSVDYIGLIPIIISALQEQDSIIAVQSTQIKALQKLVKKESNLKSARISTDVSSTNETEASLDQCIPNPFNQTTNIGYYLPETISKAILNIFDMNGAQIKSIPLQQKGKGIVPINGSELRPGMYMYSLIVDNNRIIDTKTMILTR